MKRDVVMMLGVFVGLIGAMGAAFWALSRSVAGIERRVPLVHARPQPQTEAGQVRWGMPNPGRLIPGKGRPSDDSGSWPAFRGADRSNVARPAAGLLRSFPPGGPPVLWRVKVGEGYAGPAIHRGRVYLLDYDPQRREEALRCLSFGDGKEIWRFTHSLKLKPNHGFSRTTPAVDDEVVVAMGPKCHVYCLEAQSGKLLWKMNPVKECGTRVPDWYTGQCVLLEGGRAILAPGGDPLMMAVEARTGKVLWRTPNPGGWGMTHSSVLPFEAGGVRQYVYCATLGVVGVAADDGKLLWKYPQWRVPTANVPTPVDVGESRIFLSGGYNTGSAMIRVQAEGGGFRVAELFRLEVKVFGSDQQTPILYGGHLYGVRPPGSLVCLNLEGEVKWASGASRRFGRGSYLLADGMLFVNWDDKRDQRGTLFVVEASPERYHELAAADVLAGPEIWAPMAFAGGRLLIRNNHELVCLDLRAQ